MKPWKPLPPVPFTSTIPEILDAIEGRWPEVRLANSDARADVVALIARVRELEAERDHERALLECAPWATYSEGETLLRAQAAEAQQLARQMMDERDEERMRVRVLEQALAESQADLARSLACWEAAGMQGRSAHDAMLALAEERDVLLTQLAFLKALA